MRRFTRICVYVTKFKHRLVSTSGVSGSAVGQGTAGSIPNGVLTFLIDLTLSAALWSHGPLNL